MGHRQAGKSKKRRKSWHRTRIQGIRFLRIDRMWEHVKARSAS
jgi:hypothetical protein